MTTKTASTRIPVEAMKGIITAALDGLDPRSASLSWRLKQRVPRGAAGSLPPED